MIALNDKNFGPVIRVEASRTAVDRLARRENLSEIAGIGQQGPV